MSNLDDKLREILEKPGKSLAGATDQTIVQIKQAFADEGYLQHNEFGIVQTYTHKATNVMTGQEWYDTFVKELSKDPAKAKNSENGSFYFMFSERDVLEAARKASGLK